MAEEYDIIIIGAGPAGLAAGLYAARAQRKTLLIEKGTNRDFGARPLRRAIEHNLEDPLSEDLLRGNFHGKDTIIVRVAEVDGEKKVVFESSATVKEPPPAQPELVGAGTAEEETK